MSVATDNTIHGRAAIAGVLDFKLHKRTSVLAYEQSHDVVASKLTPEGASGAHDYVRNHGIMEASTVRRLHMKLVLQITLGILLVPVAILVLFFLGGVVIGATRDSSDALEAITASFDDTGIKATVNADKLVLQATQYGTRANADRNPRATCAEFASRLLAEHPVDAPAARLTTIRMYHGYTTGNLQWVDCPIWP